MYARHFWNLHSILLLSVSTTSWYQISSIVQSCYYIHLHDFMASYFHHPVNILTFHGCSFSFQSRCPGTKLLLIFIIALVRFNVKSLARRLRNLPRRKASLEAIERTSYMLSKKLITTYGYVNKRWKLVRKYRYVYVTTCSLTWENFESKIAKILPKFPIKFAFLAPRVVGRNSPRWWSSRMVLQKLLAVRSSTR